MRTKTLILLLLVGFVGGMTIVSSAEARRQNEAAAFLIKVGRSFYERGRVEEAMKEFSKALILDPDNKQAKNYLRKMGLSDGMYTSPKTYSSQIADLSRHVTNYKINNDILSEERKEAEQKALELEKDRNQIHLAKQVKALEVDVMNTKIRDAEKESQRLANNYQHQARAQKKEWKEIENRHLVKIENLNDICSIQEKKLDIHQASLSDKTNQLMVLNEKLQEVSDIFAKYEYHLTRLEEKYAQLQEKIIDRQHQHKRIVNALEDYMNLHRIRLGRSENDLVTKEMDLARSQWRLFDTVGDLVKTDDSLSDFQDQVDDREALILEKNKDLEFLRDTIDEVNLTVARRESLIEEQDQLIFELKEQLDQAQKQIEDMMAQ